GRCRDGLGLSRGRRDRQRGQRFRHRLRDLGLGRDRLADWGAIGGRQPALLRRDHVLVDPALDADRAEGGLRGGAAEVDVGPQGVERDTAFAVPFAARHLGAAQAAAAVDPHAFRARAHGAEDRLLHGALVADPALDLARDVFRHQLSVELGLLDLLDGDAHAVAETLLEVLAQLVHARSALADDYAWLGGVDG